MDTSTLKKLVFRYIDELTPSYAIMVNGQWGCGKTTFIERALNEQNKKFYRVSLYGVNSAEEINDRLFAEITSIEDSSDKDFQIVSKTLGKLLGGLEDVNGGVVGAAASAVGSVARSRILSSISRDTILVFDDIERAEIPPNQALSAINRFVEDRKLNVILLCDESKIDDDKYRVTKEKAVLHTLQLEMPPEEVVDIVFSTPHNLPCDILEVSKLALREALQTTGCSNIRTIKHAIDNYFTLTGVLLEANPSHEEKASLTALMFPCLAFAIGFRDYGLTTAELKEYSRNYEQVAYTIAYEEADDDSENNETRYNKSLVEFSRKVGEKAPMTLELESVFKAVCLGDIDPPLLKLDMNRLMGKSFADFQIIARVGHGLSEDEFQEVVQRTVSKLKAYELRFTSCTELFQLINNLHQLNSGGGIRESIRDLEIMADQVAEEAFERDQIENGAFLCDIRDDAPGFLKSLHAKLSDFPEKIEEQNRLKEQRSLLIEGLSGSPGNLSDLNRLGRTPFLSDDLIDEVFEKLKHASHDVVFDFCRLINSRYNSRDLENEISYLQRLRALVQKHVASLQNSLLKFHLNRLVEYLEAAEKTLTNHAH
jgi:nucleoside-triphosphatase THEP1